MKFIINYFDHMIKNTSDKCIFCMKNRLQFFRYYYIIFIIIFTSGDNLYVK